MEAVDSHDLADCVIVFATCIYRNDTRRFDLHISFRQLKEFASCPRSHLSLTNGTSTFTIRCTQPSNLFKYHPNFILISISRIPLRNGRVVFEMLNVSVLTEERGGGERWRRSSLVSQLANVPGTGRERGERKVSLRGLGSLAFHAWNEIRLAIERTHFNLRFVDTIRTEVEIRYISTRMNEPRRKSYSIVRNFVQQSLSLPRYRWEEYEEEGKYGKVKSWVKRLMKRRMSESQRRRICFRRYS